MKRNNIIIILGLVLLCFTFQISYGQGARYTGSYTQSSTIKHIGKNNFVIDGLEISSTGDDYCIVLYNCENVVIKNCKFGPSLRTRAIYLENCKNVTIIDCTFENVQSGLRANASQGIKFEYNDVTNVIGKLKGGINVGVMAQFINVSGAGNSVSYNVCENFPGESSTEDIINLFSSHGTAQSPITVKGNWIRGGGPSKSGGGINLGDGGGSYQIAEDNILVDPGQYGVGIAGGHNMTLRNNKVYAKKQSFTNVAIGACNWYEEKGRSHTITVEKNIVNFTSYNGNTGNSWWIHENVQPVIGIETNKYDPNLSASILPDKIIGRARSSSVGKPAPPPSEDTPDKSNDPSISIYLDKYNRICINNRASLESSATAIAKDTSGKTIHEESLTRFHTVLPKIASGMYTVLVKNGNKTHEKALRIP